MNLGCNLQEKRGIWIKLPIQHVNLVEATVKVNTRFQCRLSTGLAYELTLNVKPVIVANDNPIIIIKKKYKKLQIKMKPIERRKLYPL